MDDLISTTGLVALGAAVVALVAFVIAIVLFVRVRRLRDTQRLVLGDHGERDLVDHAARLELAFTQLREWVEETGAGLDSRMGSAEQRIDRCITHRALVRYDAWGEMSGSQSSTIALLDTHRSGLVVSSILHRDQARVYVKAVVEGRSELELSPEEQEAIENAVGQAPAQA
ncbi:MAG: DUF4446 family protein [Thermoleophilaceae bacterium]